MARKRKGNQKKRQQANMSVENRDPGTLLKMTRQYLMEGDGRRAHDCVRRAASQIGARTELSVLEFCALNLRAQYLERRGISREASEFRNRARQRHRDFAVARLTNDDLILYFRCLDLNEAVRLYAEDRCDPELTGRIERLLADRIISSSEWEVLEALRPESPLRMGADRLAAGTAAMEAGEWRQAFEHLQGVARRSPYAPWKIFCKAMDCFGEGDFANLEKALNHLPGDFILAKTAEELRHVCTGEAREKPSRVGILLGRKDSSLELLAADFEHKLAGGSRSDLERALMALADALCPDSPAVAREELTYIAALFASETSGRWKIVEAMARKFLPLKRMGRFRALTSILEQRGDPERWDPVPAADYFRYLDRNVSDDRERSLTKARILEELARYCRLFEESYHIPGDIVQALDFLLGRQIEDFSEIGQELLRASLEADPRNRRVYIALLDRLKEQYNQGSSQLEVLDKMSEYFPEDPTPWLEKANLFYRSNAYRKAEKALKKAREIAPWDDRVLDLRAVAALVSADQCRKRGSLERASGDFELAESLGRPVLREVLPAKGMLLQMVSSSGRILDVLNGALNALLPFDQLRTLTLLRKDLIEEKRSRDITVSMLQAVDQAIKDRKPLLRQLAQGEIVALMTPLHLDLAVLYGRKTSVANGLEEYWGELLEQLNGEAFIELSMYVLDCGGQEEIFQRINARDRGPRLDRKDPQVRFLLAVVRYLTHRNRDARLFRDIIRKADAETLDRLRAFSVRMSRHTHGYMKDVLSRFRFERLDPYRYGEGDNTSVSFDEEEDDEFDSKKTALEILNDLELINDQDTQPGDRAACRDIIDTLEDLITEGGIRGASRSTLRFFAKQLNTDPEMGPVLKCAGMLCKKLHMVDELSRELKTIMYARATA